MGQAQILQEPLRQEPAARYPLTSRQKDPGRTERAPKHVIALALRIKGELRTGALQGALDDVVERHESLRTRISYSHTDGNLGYQEVLPPLPVPLTVHDIYYIPMVPGQSRDQIAAGLYASLHDELLPFTEAPSLRAALHRFDDHDAVLTLLTHHLYSDGWSAEILRHEIAACYRARVNGIPHALPPAAQYRQYQSWEQQYLQTDAAAAARRYWAAKLAGAQMHTMPADRPHGPATLAPRSAVANFTISPGDFTATTATATRNRCTAWHLILTAFMVLAARTRGTTDITLLTVSNGRPPAQFHDTIGFFANPLPLRLEFGNCTSYLDLMLLARKTSAQAQQNQIPFGTILEQAPGLMNGLGNPRAIPHALTYNSSPATIPDIETAATIEPVTLPEEVPSMFHRGACIWAFTTLPTGAFRLVIEYEPDAAAPATINSWGTTFTTLIHAITENPTHPWNNN